MEPDNPYTFLEGYKVYDRSRNEAGEIGQTVYDAPADVLKYVVVDGHTVPAERIEVNADEESVSVPYDREKIKPPPNWKSPPASSTTPSASTMRITAKHEPPCDLARRGFSVCPAFGRRMLGERGRGFRRRGDRRHGFSGGYQWEHGREYGR